ncbi:rho GDP dissociation inhibitor Rdi1 [Schizosaccharomyces japonicus yFS275]|uniref:Rho GDP dissociation inhibitor Rdi1 n=1 Tax=Schizosaccharomyces japonicus (strain yFS275 / FY16936) TaxID=402676 RepID=B6K413_SCHJY|nr:rho GDP dissociation inhibitor Rdi1 [Schizosaccharomyces japonicus yFS275]EEB08220.1 rho GDP dissociation inhibitor Rdi1 [Schizosaccharomyces japonicus yFS275]
MDPIETSESERPSIQLGEKKTVNEYLNMDAEDESLRKWKESLGIKSDGGYSPPNDPRTVVVERLTLLVDGEDPVEVDMQDAESLERIRKHGFAIRERCVYRTVVRFRVQHEVISGLQYVRVVSRHGIPVDKSAVMIGSYSPSKEAYEYTTEPEEAPSGMLARGHYEASCRFVDDDKVTHKQFKWAFNLVKK